MISLIVVILIILAIPFIIVGLLSELFLWALALLVAVILLIVNGVRKRKVKSNIKEYEDFYNNKAEMNYNVEADVEDKLNELNLFDISIYDNLFEPQIRYRGKIYYNNSKIINYKEELNKCSCKCIGTKNYKVSITFNKNDLNKIKEVHCECQYHNDTNKYCKHVYALLLKNKTDSDKEKMLYSLDSNKKVVNEILKKASKYKNYSDYTNYLYDCINCLYDSLNKKDYANPTTSDLELSYTNLFKSKNYLKELKVITSNKKYNEISIGSDKKTEKNDKFSTLLGGVAIASLLDNDKSKKKDDHDYLEDWQNDLVKKGDYKPYNFEEEDLEEDDYYYEDDK